MPVFLLKFGNIMFSYLWYNRPPARVGNLRMYVPPPFYLLPGVHLPLLPLGNSRLPELTQTNLVNIYLFHADSGYEVLRVTNEINPFGRAGSIAKQVNDSWFPNGGVSYSGSSISYPYYWVITRSDKTLDGTESPQATFSAVRKCCLCPCVPPVNRPTPCRDNTRRLCDIVHCIFVICCRCRCFGFFGIGFFCLSRRCSIRL
jgi:hypothetical protein